MLMTAQWNATKTRDMDTCWHALHSTKKRLGNENIPLRTLRVGDDAVGCEGTYIVPFNNRADGVAWLKAKGLPEAWMPDSMTFGNAQAPSA